MSWLSATDTELMDISPCLDRLRTFASDQEIELDLSRISIAERWAGGGHEFNQVPGASVALPVDACDGVLSIDIAPDCTIVSSHGDGGCRGRYPRVIY